MSDYNRDALPKVIGWLSYAYDDLCLAKNTLETMKDGCPYRLVAYHAQQCAEKRLKAYLVFHNIDFPYSHDISRLLELCAEKANWTGKLQNAEELSMYAIARYPEDGAEVTEEDARSATAIAEGVRQVVRKALLDDGVRIGDFNQTDLGRKKKS